MSRQGQRSPVETRESAITATDRDNAGEFKTCTQPPSMSIRRPSTNESDDEEEEQLEDYLHPHSKQGFLRPRQRSNGSSSSSSSDMPPRSYSLGSENIRKFSQESLYSYSFTPSLPRSNRMRIMRHGMDFVRRIRCKLDDRVTRRYSHPDIGASTFDWQMNTWSTVNTPRTSIDYDSMVANGNGSDPTTMTTTTHPMDDIPSSSSSSLSKQQRKTSMTKRPSTDTSCNNAESCQSYRRILHTPTRFLPQNQAIFTTDHDGTILLFNDIASLCFVMDKSHVGQSLLTVLQQPFRDKTARLLRDRTAGDEDPVLVCGTVVPIIKTNGEKSAASLWLKRKERDGGKIVYIWIFEEILESTLTAYLDPKGTINQVIGKMQELYGYSNEQVIDKHISLLIPSLNADPSSTIDVAATMKFFGSQTKYGAFFPAMGTLHANNDHTAFTLKIISLPTVAGMITIHTNGMIQSMSAVPAKYLFGYPTVDSLVEKVPISQLLPQLPEILDNLQRDGLWGEDGNIIGNTTCRRALVPRDLATTTDHKLSISSNNNNNAPPLPVIYAVHHDGSQFEVQLRLRSITSAEGQLISVWVAFDRIQSLNRRNSTKRKASSPSTTQQQPHNDDNDNDNDDNDPQEHNPNMDDHPHCHGHGHEKKARSTFRSRRVVQMAKARAPLPNRSLAPVVELSEPNPESPTTTSPDLDVSSPPEQRPPPLPTDEHHPLDDYEILDTLGEGTYGAAKLAYRKDDEAQKMVVIKCIRKSRILVDSWMRDRRYGDIVPAEIHILRTLQQCPQQNCCSLLAHMEDQDFYYVVMALHGDGMDLFDYIELNEEICEQEVRAIFRQVAEAVRHLHHNKIVHRDIKDENIILDESGTVLLIDFGSAAYFRSGKKFETFCGTMEYWAPELLQGISYDGPPQDIWSLGILLHTLIFRETPFYQLDDILEDQLHIRDLPYPGPHDILHKMLNKDPSKRPTIDDVLADPWFVQ